jgi:protein TonB
MVCIERDRTTPCHDNPVVRLKFSLIVSGLLHAAFIGALWGCDLVFDFADASYAVQSGRPLTVRLVAASPAAPLEIAVTIPESVEIPAPAASPPNEARQLEPLDTNREKRAENALPQPATLPNPSAPPAIRQPPIGELARRPTPRDELENPQPPPPRSRINPMPDVRLMIDERASLAMVPPSPDDSGAQTDQLPRSLLNNPPPEYPYEELVAGVEGRVMIRAFVRVDGRVGELSIFTSSGSQRLDQAALAAVRIWRFEPARRRGQLIGRDVIIPVTFSIRRS